MCLPACSGADRCICQFPRTTARLRASRVLTRGPSASSFSRRSLTSCRWERVRAAGQSATEKGSQEACPPPRTHLEELQLLLGGPEEGVAEHLCGRGAQVGVTADHGFYQIPPYQVAWESKQAGTFSRSSKDSPAICPYLYHTPAR